MQSLQAQLIAVEAQCAALQQKRDKMQGYYDSAIEKLTAEREARQALQTALREQVKIWRTRMDVAWRGHAVDRVYRVCAEELEYLIEHGKVRDMDAALHASEPR